MSDTEIYSEMSETEREIYIKTLDTGATDAAKKLAALPDAEGLGTDNDVREAVYNEGVAALTLAHAMRDRAHGNVVKDLSGDLLKVSYRRMAIEKFDVLYHNFRNGEKS